MIDVACAYCGNLADKYSSGTAECWPCWNWRKLDSSAAHYWTKAIDQLFNNENGSGPDANDIAQWKRWGMLDSVSNALYTLQAIRSAYQTMIDNPRPWNKKGSDNA